MQIYDYNTHPERFALQFEYVSATFCEPRHMKRFPGQSRDIWLDTVHGMLERSIMFVAACCHVHITHARALLLLTATCVERCEKDISWC